MTNEEAIEFLRNMLPEKISYADLVGANSCYGSGEYVYTDPEPYAIEIAIQALEKQVAMKPQGEYKLDKNKIKTKLCSKCDWILADYDMYCSNCGQKIDWGKYND